MYREFKSFFFSTIFRYYTLLFCSEVSSNKYHYWATFVQSLSAYATNDRLKKLLVKDDLYWASEASPTLGVQSRFRVIYPILIP